MATDTNQTIQDSRRAAMSFLDAAKKREERRNNRRPDFSGDTDTDVERRPRLADPDDFTDTAIEESIRKGAKNRRAAKRAVDDFWRTAMRKGANNGTANVAPKEEESGFDLHYRFRNMSDDDFYKGVADGSITPEQIRKAGEYAHDVYMGDVWTEQDENWDKPEPTYDEFIADPAKYGYEEDTEFPERLYRYKPGAAQGVINGNKMQGK